MSQTLFNTTRVPSPSWRSYVTSSVVHGFLILALLLITFPALRNQMKHPASDIALIAPQIPQLQSKIPQIQHISPSQVTTKTELKPRPLPAIKPPEVKPVEVKRPVLAAAAEIKNISPVTPVKPVLQPEVEPPAPKPPVRTGTFESVEAAKAQPAPKELKVGGFGDPNGIRASQNASQAGVMMAKVGSFDSPKGSGTAGGRGHGSLGEVRQTSFGNGGETGGSSGGTARGGGNVYTGAFGESIVAASQSPAMARQAAATPVFAPVEILYKPKPNYTDEARNLKLEGQVSLEVVFLSTGSVRIVRVIHGLGHGLDQAAQQAALQVRFRPATRDGVPVDSNATIHITFQLT
ncbi:MAG: energy transducer TonB [Acidobacteriota bacterium]|nr:energy transducer TonB [Acidobacteriota bacterium]